ncbi:uncharacterized protein PV09_08149 [Verruconis gallopava]|uniref:Rhodopsin domain-containing protein n=1 Tax=Verruconis gallopava TaxID=253628 RepID=A0A0D2AM87_9PEZI|nr:uncharacterized protein PV09_08149 [Verruconis gallopava]KIW00259.1 hypothetical protein PV09_08149 [Verruconis gallopava]
MGGGLHPPLSVILSWPPSNYVDPVTHGHGVIVMEGVLLGLCYFIVALRVYTRLFQAKNFGLDDVLIMFNLIPLTGLAVCLILAFARYGWDRHIWDIPPQKMVAARKVALSIEITYLISTCTTKISILLFYRRLGGSVSRRFRYCIYFAIGFVIVNGLVFFVDSFVQCRPLSAFWNQGNIYWVAANQGDWHCGDEAATVVCASVISMLQDFIACLLPMALFRKLKIARKKKIALGCIFGVGFFLCICGMLRMITTVKVYYQTYDLTWESLQVWIWTGIESHMAIVCASLPALNHFFRNVLKDETLTSGIRSWSNKYSKSSSGSKSKDYGHGTSQSSSLPTNVPWMSSDPKMGVIVTKSVQLEEVICDKKYNLRNSDLESAGDQWTQGVNFVDQDSYVPRSSNTWLEDETSSGEERVEAAPQPTRKYSGFADLRRLY